MTERAYRSESWIDPRIAIRPSPLHGRGSFATAPIASGETVIIWGGIVFTEDDVKAGRVKKGSISYIGEGRVLAAPAGSPDDGTEYLNHSCDPNLWMLDEVTLAARRPIATDEELLADYAMWEGDDDWVRPWACQCGSALCRRVLSGQDWRNPELQHRYQGHFAPFINLRIAEATGRR